MSKTLVRFKGKDGRGLRAHAFHPGSWQGHNPEYPVNGGKDCLMNREMEGDHVYEYLGTVKRIEGAKTKVPVPFKIGLSYDEQSRWGRLTGNKRVFMGTFKDEAIWSSVNKGVWYRTKLDGTPLTVTGVTMVPDYNEVSGEPTFALVKEPY